jgi:hypothetical protein
MKELRAYDSARRDMSLAGASSENTAKQRRDVAQRENDGSGRKTIHSKPRHQPPVMQMVGPPSDGRRPKTPLPKSRVQGKGSNSPELSENVESEPEASEGAESDREAAESQNSEGEASEGEASEGQAPKAAPRMSALKKEKRLEEARRREEGRELERSRGKTSSGHRSRNDKSEGPRNRSDGRHERKRYRKETIVQSPPRPRNGPRMSREVFDLKCQHCTLKKLRCNKQDSAAARACFQCAIKRIPCTKAKEGKDRRAKQQRRRAKTYRDDSDGDIRAGPSQRGRSRGMETDYDPSNYETEAEEYRNRSSDEGTTRSHRSRQSTRPPSTVPPSTRASSIASTYYTRSRASQSQKSNGRDSDYEMQSVYGAESGMESTSRPRYTAQEKGKGKAVGEYSTTRSMFND